MIGWEIKELFDAVSKSNAAVSDLSTWAAFPDVGRYHLRSRQQAIDASLFMSVSSVSVAEEVRSQAIGYSMDNGSQAYRLWKVAMKSGETLLLDLQLTYIDTLDNSYETLVDGCVYVVSDQSFVSILEEWCKETMRSNGLREIASMFAKYKEQAASLLNGLPPERHADIATSIRNNTFV